MIIMIIIIIQVDSDYLETLEWLYIVCKYIEWLCVCVFVSIYIESCLVLSIINYKSI